MAGRTRSVPQESIKKTTTARLAIEKPKVTYNIERIDAPKPAPLVVTYKKLNPEDKTKSGSPGDVEKDKEAVFFDINSSIISEKEKKKLIAWIDSVKSNRYKVLGFSCSTSEESNNMSLSENRAETVRKIIMERRKDAIVTTQGMGRSQSFSQNDQSLNRRANIIALEGEPVKKSVIIVPADTVSNKLEAVKHKVLEEKKHIRKNCLCNRGF
jgi:outer membrane protein OmpA-like peptidoglycan-associated protein